MTCLVIADSDLWLRQKPGDNDKDAVHKCLPKKRVICNVLHLCASGLVEGLEKLPSLSLQLIIIIQKKHPQEQASTV